MLHILFNFLHLWRVRGKKEEMHMKNQKHRNSQWVSKAILTITIISSTATTPATRSAIRHELNYMPRNVQQSTKSLSLNFCSTSGGLCYHIFLVREIRLIELMCPSRHSYEEMEKDGLRLKPTFLMTTLSSFSIQQKTFHYIVILFYYVFVYLRYFQYYVTYFTFT